jgi:hypothetical protein
MQGRATAITWWLESETGGRSKPYASEADAWAALDDLQSSQTQMNLLYARPAWLVSSDGVRFAIPVKTSITNERLPE